MDAVVGPLFWNLLTSSKGSALFSKTIEVIMFGVGDVDVLLMRLMCP